MEVFEAIHHRRSIRKYTPQEIPHEFIEKMLRAAMAAPSAGNEQPWHFIVLARRELLDQIPGFHPHAEMLSQANKAIVVCVDQKLDRHRGMWVQDCSAAVQNILLAAHALGLGAVWVGLYPRQERTAPMCSLLSLPEHVIPFALIPLGYPAEIKAPEDRFRAKRIHRDGW